MEISRLRHIASLSFYFLLISILFSCSFTSSGNEEGSIDLEKDQIREKRAEHIANLTKENSPKALLDTCKFNYSYEYSPLLGDIDLLVDRFYLSDLFLRNDSLFTLINVRGRQWKSLELSISEGQRDSLLQYSSTWPKQSEAAIIIHLRSMKKYSFEVTSYPDGGDVEFEIRPSKNYFGLGKLISIKPHKNDINL